jgi:hypothetical protein
MTLNETRLSYFPERGAYRDTAAYEIEGRKTAKASPFLRKYGLLDRRLCARFGQHKRQRR